MLYNAFFVIFLFLLYSVIGYIAEVIKISLNQKKVVLSRGYLIGTWLPIYGFGALLMIYCFSKYKKDLFVLFMVSLCVCTILEYFTSLVFEKIFKLRWWDYSNKKLNINGRVCLENGIMFGFLGIIIVSFVNPLIVSFIRLFPNNILIYFTIFIFGFFLIDFVLSTYIIFMLKIDTKKYVGQDATVVIKEEVISSLKKYDIFHRRLFKAFPNILDSKNLNMLFDVINKYKANKKEDDYE